MRSRTMIAKTPRLFLVQIFGHVRAFWVSKRRKAQVNESPIPYQSAARGSKLAKS